MISPDAILKGFSILSTVIATLRASSRAVYLMNHDAIGIMDGPGIERPTGNESSTLYDLSEAFRHCVRLSMAPHFYNNVRFDQPVSSVVDSYPLSAKPYIGPKTKAASDGTEETEQETSEEAVHQIIGDCVNETLLEHGNATNETWNSSATYQVQSTPPSPSFTARLALALNPINGAKVLLNKIPPTLEQSQQYISITIEQSHEYLKATPELVKVTPKLAKYYVQRAFWNRRKDKDEESDIEDSDWDHNLSTDAEIRFKSDGKSRVAELSVFAPETFENLRDIFGISQYSYQQSIFRSGTFVSFQSNSKGAARTGGIFFFTRDGAYMVKTIKKEEAKTFLKMLPKYHKHMKRHGLSSLLTRFCGMYGVRMYDEDSFDHGKLHTFIVMNAVFPAEASSFVTERFDLKGSTVGREVSEEELKSKGSNAVLKDLDLAREVDLSRSMGREGQSSEYGFCIGAAAKAALLSQLREDVKLLVECNVMDYSLLVGVVDMVSTRKQDEYAREALETLQEQGRHLEQLEGKKKKTQKLNERALSALSAPVRLLLAPPSFAARKLWSLGRRTMSTVITLPLPYYGSGRCGVDGGRYSVLHGRRRRDRAVYYLGLIDFLQPWTARKVVERKLKGLIGQDINAISCVDPEEYANRFLEFLDANIS